MSLIVTRVRKTAQDRRWSPGTAKVINDLADAIWVSKLGHCFSQIRTLGVILGQHRATGNEVARSGVDAGVEQEKRIGAMAVEEIDRGKQSDLSIAYLATPYTRYIGGVEQAFVDASTIAAKLLRAGINVYCPISHCHPLAVYGEIDPLDHAIWLPFNEAMLAAAQTLIVAHMDGWQESRGVTHEIETFERTKRPIFDLDPATMTLKRRKG